MSTQSYYEKFNSLVDVIGHIGGSIGMGPDIMQQVASSHLKDMNDLPDSDRKEVYEQCLATAFILGAD
jgi:hypothetical protein